MAPLRWVGQPSFRALLLRRTSPELIMSLWERAFSIYPGLGARENVQNKLWRFPSGATITFGHLEHEHSVRRYQSAEFQFIFFDELTHFLESQYIYMMSRLRSTAGIPLRMRGGTNPGGEGHEWVLRRFAPWLFRPGVRADEYAGPYAQPGEKWWFVRDARTNTETRVDPGSWLHCEHCDAEWKATGPAPNLVDKKKCHHPVALSRVFFPANVEDNPHVDASYRAALQQLDPLSYLQLRLGDWMARPEPGMFFKEPWFAIHDDAPTWPEIEALVRYWDRAATEEDEEKKKDPDWTVGVLMARDIYGRFWVLDVERFRCEPHDVEDRIDKVSERDAANVRENGDPIVYGADELAVRYTVRLEQDPGQAGKVEIAHLGARLARFNVQAVLPTGDKVTRAKPWSASCKLGLARLVRAPWNQAYIREHCSFPAGKKDQVDASSGAHAFLAGVTVGPRRPGKKRETAANVGGY